jgi:hypothetical protein
MDRAGENTLRVVVGCSGRVCRARSPEARVIRQTDSNLSKNDR